MKAYEVSIINSNPATIMTDKVIADHVYLLPLTPESIEQILQERQIDAVLPTMGGQTALNLCIAVATSVASGKNTVLKL
jgi:carbamoyl-phosphate synthase large subunit